MIDDKQTAVIAEAIETALQKLGFITESRGSVISTRGYIGATKEETDEFFIVQVDRG